MVSVSRLPFRLSLLLSFMIFIAAFAVAAPVSDALCCKSAWDLPPTGIITFKSVNNIVAQAKPGSLSATVCYLHPTAATTCPGGKVIVSLTHGMVSGSEFPIGVTELWFTASDTCGNEAVQRITVTVRKAKSANTTTNDTPDEDVPPTHEIRKKDTSNPDGSGLLLFPNPARNVLIADMTQLKLQRVSLSVLNTQGVRLHTEPDLEGSVAQTLDLPSEWPNGCYFLQVRADNRPVTTRCFEIIR